MKNTLCPFSKPIIGRWCQCQYANLDERCAGKMTCLEAQSFMPRCRELVDLFKENALFVLGISSTQEELTHMQLMKIRCGGLQGMQRILNANTEQIPDIILTLQLANNKFGDIRDFPFDEIIRDIQSFSHRKKKQPIK